jgi:hypothetical protein
MKHVEAAGLLVVKVDCVYCLHWALNTHALRISLAVRFEALAAASIKINTSFWDTAPYCFVEVD